MHSRLPQNKAIQKANKQTKLTGNLVGNKIANKI